MNKTTSGEQSNLLKDEEGLDLQQPTIKDENEEAKKKQRMKCIGISVGIAVAIAILIVILVLVLKKSEAPPSPDGPTTPGVNPYNVIGMDTKPESHGPQKFYLGRDSSVTGADNLVTGGNTYFDNVTLSAQLLSYQSARIQIFQSDHFHNSYHVPQTYLSEDYNKLYEQGLFFNHLGFKVGFQSKFSMRLYDQHTKQDYVTTEGEAFLAMKYYMQIGYKIESQRLFGFGERTRDFRLQQGTYVLYPQTNAYKVDDGTNKDPAQQGGMHPFLMAQLRNATFFGIYIMNSNAQQVQIKYSQEIVQVDGESVTKYFSHVVFTSNGGALDTFYFVGPTYQEVLRQYHSVIGKPLLPPLMASGLWLSNDDLYDDQTKLSAIIKDCKDNAIPLEGVVIPPTAQQNQYTFTLSYATLKTLKELQGNYPGTKFVYPFSPFIPDGYAPASLLSRNLIVQANGTDLGVTQTLAVAKPGKCFDFFNEKAIPFLEEIFEPNVDYNTVGFWLYHNLPTFSANNLDGKTVPADVNPYQSIPFWPGDKAQTYTKTIPSYSKSTIRYNDTTPVTQDHFYLHGLFGTEMATKIQLAASEHNQTAQAFIVTENTFPGAGARGLAHVFPKLELTEQSLKYGVAQMFNFHMFGIPYASPNICGYKRSATFTPAEETLCVRSFSLALVSPLAVYNTNGADISKAGGLSDAGISQIKSNLEARLSLLMYQRTELYKIQNIGGALVRPLFTEYPNLPQFTPEMVDTCMYGDYLKVDFTFTGESNKQVLIPPGTLWLELFTYNQVWNKDGGDTVTMTATMNHPIILQKEGTVIPIQNVVKEKVKTTSELRNTPLRLSVLLDQSKYSASGHVLIEDGKGAQEFYEVRATRDSISFKQHNEGTVDSMQRSKNIDMIRVAAMPMTFSTFAHVACAVLQDHHTVQQLYVRTFHNDELEITPYNQDDTSDKTTLNIDNVAFIYYGIQDPLTMKCDQSLMQGKAKLKVLDGPYTKEYVVSQNIQKLVSHTPDLNFVATLEDDHTIYVSWYEQTDSELGRRLKAEHTKPKVRDPAYTIDKVLTINQDPFYVEIHSYQENPTDPKTVYWTTKDTSFIFAQDYSMFTFQQPNTDKDKFFGIGERKGEFYLQENYQYSMHTNNHNMKDIKQGKRTVQFCKNGFFPIIFARAANDNSRMMATYLTEGSRDIFFNHKLGATQVPNLSVVQMVNFASIRVIYDSVPLQLMRDTHRNVLNPEGLRIPPAWALGQYHLVRNFADSGEFTAHQDFYSKIGWPLEGFVLDLNFTGFESLRLSPTKIEGGNFNFTIQYLNQKNLTLWQVMKAGIPKRSGQAGKLVANSSAIAKEPYWTMTQTPVTGLDQQGEVIYANYYTHNFVLTEYTQGAFQSYERTYLPHTYGVQLIHNEIYDPFCSQDCFRDSQYDPMPGQFYKVGIDKMLRNSLSANARRNVDTHNGYGFRQQLQLLHSDFDKKKFFISSSNTPGSGKFGNVGRWIDYIDHEDDAQVAVVALQSLSLLGMGAIGEKFGSVGAKVGDKVVNQHITIQTFSPLAAHQWLQTNPMGTEDIKAGPLVRYKYMLIRYTQTLLFKQTYYGDPLIHPLFIDFYMDDTTWNSEYIKTQYMYGDFLVSIALKTQGMGNTYFPKGTWCAPYNFMDPFCFNSTGQAISQSQRYFYVRPGSILPLQDAFGRVYNLNKPVNTTKDLIDVPIDLHINIFVDELGELAFSNGALLYYDDEHDKGEYCYVELIHRNDTITFEMKVGRDINQCKFKGYRAGRIYIYNPKVFKFTNIILNADPRMAQMIITPIDLNPHYKYFDLTAMPVNVNWYDIFVIQFT